MSEENYSGTTTARKSAVTICSKSKQVNISTGSLIEVSVLVHSRIVAFDRRMGPLSRPPDRSADLRSRGLARDNGPKLQRKVDSHLLLALLASIYIERKWRGLGVVSSKLEW